MIKPAPLTYKRAHMTRLRGAQAALESLRSQPQLSLHSLYPPLRNLPTFKHCKASSAGCAFLQTKRRPTRTNMPHIAAGTF